MHIGVQIQDEDGNAVATYDGPNIGHEFLKMAPPTGACLRFVLPWEDTTFNSLQIEELRGELQQILRGAEDSNRIREAEALLQFVSRIEGPHMYLKFLGD